MCPRHSEHCPCSRKLPIPRPSRQKEPRRCGDDLPQPAPPGLPVCPRRLELCIVRRGRLPSIRPSRQRATRRCASLPPRPASPDLPVCPRRLEPHIGRRHSIPSMRPSRQKEPRRCGDDLPQPAPPGLPVCPRRLNLCIVRRGRLPSTRPSLTERAATVWKSPAATRATRFAGVPTLAWRPCIGRSIVPQHATEPSERTATVWAITRRDLHHRVCRCAHAARNRALAVAVVSPARDRAVRKDRDGVSSAT